MTFDSLWTDETVLTEVGRRLERLRLDRNESQAQLAERAGVSRATVIRIEQGHSITLKALVRLLRALNLLDGFDALIPPPAPSPLAQLNQPQPRQRASKPRTEPSEPTDDPDSGFQWGTA